MLYLISYDLHAPEKNYSALQEVIERLGPSNRCQGSVWLLQTRITVDEIQGELQKVIDADDRIVVVEITGMPRNGWMNRTVWDWMRAHDF